MLANVHRSVVNLLKKISMFAEIGAVQKCANLADLEKSSISIYLHKSASMQLKKIPLKLFLHFFIPWILKCKYTDK